jgi:putative ABC transport system ATP-binding protein
MSDAMIRLRGVCKAYGDNVRRVVVFEGLDLTAARGDLIAILGPSGSGKTTLLNIIAGLDKPDAGQVMIEGTDIAGMSPGAIAGFRRPRLGFVFQRFNLLAGLSAIENVVLPLRLNHVAAAEAVQRAEAALRRVGLEERLGSEPSQLSVGELQRVAVARAIVLKPSIILADEPTGSLDSASKDAVLHCLCESNDAVTILVTHDDSVAERCNTRYVLTRDGLVQSD